MSTANEQGVSHGLSVSAEGGDVRSPVDLAVRPHSSSSFGQPGATPDVHAQGQPSLGGGASSDQQTGRVPSASVSQHVHQLAPPPGQPSSTPQTDPTQSHGSSPQSFNHHQQQDGQPSSSPGQQSYASHLFYQQQQQAHDQSAFPSQPPSAHLTSQHTQANVPASASQPVGSQQSSHLPPSNLSSFQQPGQPSSASPPGAAMASASSPSSSSLPTGPAHLATSQPQNDARSPSTDTSSFSPMAGFPAVGSLGGYPTGDGSTNGPSTLSPAASSNQDADQANRDRTRTASSGAGLGLGRETGEKRTLWLGDLEPWMDEAYLRSMASLMGWDIVAIKLIRPAPQQNPNPMAVIANGYCFLTFPTAHLASRILHTLTPTPTNPPIMMPNSQRPFKANWASSSTSSTNPAAVNPAQMTDIPPEREYSIFVGDLAPEVGEGDLVRLFLNPPTRGEAEGGPRKPYTSTRSAKIMLDPGGGGSRGYGFVRFGEEADQLRALAEMQGVYCLSRPMRLSHATAKNKSGLSVGGSQGGSVASSSRVGTPIPPLSGGGYDALPSPSHLGSLQHHQASSPLQQQTYNPYDGLSSNGQQAGGLSAGANTGPTNYDRSPSSNNVPIANQPSGAFDQQQRGQQQQQTSVNPLPPPQRRLSPNTIEYLTQLAAANGGTLPFGPGMTLPALPAAPSAGPSGGGGNDIHPSLSSSSVPSLTIPDSRDPRQFQNPNQHDPRSRSPSSGISPSSSPFPPSTSGSSYGGGGPAQSSFLPTIQIPSNNQQQYQHQQQQFQQQSHQQQMPHQRSESMASIGSPLSPTTANAQRDAIYNEGGGNAAGNSTDPNNTTVFVGGLSSLISEETLKTFFTPFGEITYVKIPPGKGCGFVQFVRKADAERAIERMQGFPIGGGRIRLSWGRSQYKAAQAAAQAAQLGLGLGALSGINGLTPAQAAQLGLALQGLGGLGPANGNLLRQLAAASSTPGFAGRGGVGSGGAGLGGLGALNGLGGQAAFGGLGGVGGFGAGPGAGAGGLGALAGLNPQTLQSLLALQAGNLGGGGGAGALNPALLARLSSQGGLGGFGSNDLGQSEGQGLDGANMGATSHSYNPVGQSNFAPFSPAQSPIAHHTSLPASNLGQNGYSANDSRRDDYGRYDDQLHQQQFQQRDDELLDQFSTYSQRHSSIGGSSAPSERDMFLNGMYSSGSTAATSPTTSTRIPGSYSQSHPSAPSHLRSVTSPGSEVSSPFDSTFRPPPLQTSTSYSSDHSSRFFGGAFSPPATAPGVPGNDYLSQQQLAPSRARAASASVHSGGVMNDLTSDMDTLDVGAGRMGTGPGSGRSFGYTGSFGGAMLRSQLSGSRYQGGGGGRFDEGGPGM